MRQQLRLSKRMERVTRAPLCEPTRKKHQWYINVKCITYIIMFGVWTFKSFVLLHRQCHGMWAAGQRHVCMSCSHSWIFAMMPSQSDHYWPLIDGKKFQKGVDTPRTIPKDT